MSGRKHKPIAIAILISMIVGLSMAHAAWAQDKKPEFPPMQAGASFNVGDIKEKIKQAQDAAAEHQD